ncbi:MAG: anti-sigma factor [Betaproteobacteria bacterium]|nr:anti-sigma factor [Betaproteobacteria bacterium]
MSPAPLREDLLHAYVDELLAPTERAQVDRYLAENPAEEERVASYRRQREVLRNAFDTVLDEPVPERIRVDRFRNRSHPAWRVAAAFVLIVFGGVLGWLLRGEYAPAPIAYAAETELVQRARMAHIIYTAENRRAVEVAASHEQDMIRWLSKRMNAAVRVPNLTEFGFQALGGRLLPGSEGPACQIMYQNDKGKRLTIYLARAGGATRPLRFGDDDKVHVVFWSDGTLAFAVSGELSNEQLARIAAAVARDSRTRG